VVSTDPDAFSQNSWIAAMNAQMQAKYPKVRLVDIRYGLGKPAESFSMAENLINKVRCQLDAIVAPTVVALPKVAEAVEQAGLTGKIVVTGLSTPNDMKEFVKRGTVKTVVLWNPVDLGYLAVYVAQASLAGSLKDNATQAKVPAGRLGTRDAVASLEDINTRGLAFTVKKALPLLNDGGAIIVITSIAENKGIPGFTAYSATKAAVRSFVRTWTAELKDRRIRVNAISPGPIDTPIFDQQAPTKEGADQARAQFAAAVPFGRLGRPEEIASTALFLASDEASFIAGVDLPVDGGM